MNRWTLSTVMALVLIPSLAAAQATTGEITGRVEDSAGAIVPGVTVTAENRDTGFMRSTLTNGEGDYLIALLPPGRYNVGAELQGFKRAVRENVLVSVGTRLTLHLLLEVGGVTEQVLVTATTPLIDTTRSEIAGVVTARDIANLPALNRTFANLAMTMPEARPAGGFDPTKTRVGNFAMNGGDGRQLDVNVDGGDNKDNVVGSLLQNFAYESIQEFQVLQHRWSAEAGRAVGGVVNVISKSGTNDLRGSGFFTFRNDDFVAKDFFQERGAVKPPFQRREYGGSVGGPLLRDRAVLLRRARAVRRAEVGNADPIAGHVQRAGGDSRVEPGPVHPDAVRRHPADGEGRSAPEQQPEPALSVLDPEELVAERPGRQSGDDRSERRQHQHQRPVRLRRQAHLLAERQPAERLHVPLPGLHRTRSSR